MTKGMTVEHEPPAPGPVVMARLYVVAVGVTQAATVHPSSIVSCAVSCPFEPFAARTASRSEQSVLLVFELKRSVAFVTQIVNGGPEAETVPSPWRQPPNEGGSRKRADASTTSSAPRASTVHFPSMPKTTQSEGSEPASPELTASLAGADGPAPIPTL